MNFYELGIKEARRIEMTPLADDRGWFARAYCQREFVDAGIKATFVQMNHSQCVKRGTLRGLHYQIPPHAEGKLIRCVRGSIFDVVLDIRANSTTFGSWVGVELSESNQTMVYCPAGCAHGYQALTDGAEVIYQATTNYAPDHERQVRFDDPAFGIQWPIPIPILSPKDAATPNVPTDFQGVTF